MFEKDTEMFIEFVEGSVMRREQVKAKASKIDVVVRAAALGFGAAVLLIGLTGCQAAYYSSATQLSKDTDASVITHYRGDRPIATMVCESKEECARSARAWKDLGPFLPEEATEDRCVEHERAFTNARGEEGCIAEEFSYGDR